jgi:hypothetical protein
MINHSPPPPPEDLMIELTSLINTVTIVIKAQIKIITVQLSD